MGRREFISLLGSTAVAWPLAVRAQQNGMPVIGFLSFGLPAPNTVAAFRQGLAETGYIEGKNVTIEFRSADRQNMPRLADDMVARKVDVIVPTGSPSAAIAAKDATSTITIVFSLGQDPVQYDLVTRLSRPGGNVTGITTVSSSLAGKRLTLLLELIPQAATIAYL